MAFDFKDFYLSYEGHPRFQVNQIIEDDLLSVIIQKYEMLIFTNKGELFGDTNFGCDLVKFLHETKLSANSIRTIIADQITRYIPELPSLNYTLKVEFFNDPERYQDIMLITLTLSDTVVEAIIV